jgi:arylsulfatase A
MTPSKPNIVLVVVDDLGYGDIGVGNPVSKIPTPNVDKLASQGVFFTNGHTSASQCSPTRYGIMTGRYSWRTRLQAGVLTPFDVPLIDKDRMTVASLLKGVGYSTACIGKWHLGLGWQPLEGKTIAYRSWAANPDTIDYGKPLTSSPNDFGFDYFFGLNASNNMVPYCFIENHHVLEIPTQLKYPVFDTESGRGLVSPDYNTQHVEKTLFGKLMGWLEKHVKDEPSKPFFLYYPMSAIHEPCLPDDPNIGRSQAGLRGDKVTEVDDLMGKLMKWLDDKGLSDNTLFIFTSDNGGRPGDTRAAVRKLADNDYGQKYNPQNLLDYARQLEEQPYYRIPDGSQTFHTYAHSSEGTNRGYKSDIYEGGHKVPFIIRWPGVVKPGEVRNDLISTLDFFATFAAIVGKEVPANAGEDSYNMLPLLNNTNLGPVRTTLVHKAWFPNKIGITSGDWKLIPFKGGGGWSKFKDITGNFQLYNLKDDPQEKVNLYDKYPDKVKELTLLLDSIKGEQGK